MLLGSAGWTGVVEVEAHVVTIKNAAMADDAGLLNPLLKRWQDQACSTMVFGLPAVQSVINFKWDRQVVSVFLPHSMRCWLQTAHTTVPSCATTHKHHVGEDPPMFPAYQ